MTLRTVRDMLVGLGYLILVAALIALAVLVYQHRFTTYTDVTLRTDSVGSSLQKGSDVKVRGVLVGSVSRVTTDGDGADVHLQLDPAKAEGLPANMAAQLLPKTLFGERFVGLEFPAVPASGHLADGDVIDQDRSARSVELEKLFSDLLPVLKAVQPEKLNATLGEVRTALEGRGPELAATLQTVGGYFAELSPQVPAIASDFEALSRTARTYTDAAPDLINALDSLSTTSQTFVSQRADYQQLLASATTVSNTIGSFVNTNQQQLIGLAQTSLPSLQLTAAYASEFPCISRALVGYIPRVNQAFGVGTAHPGAHVTLHVVPRTGPYSLTDLPSFAASGAASCPYSPPTSLANTALSGTPQLSGAAQHTASGQVVADNGMGSVNSPQENELIAELTAPAASMTPRQFPKWGSLLLGPAMRGMQVGLK